MGKIKKSYSPCSICGYDIYTERHHPDGKGYCVVIHNAEDQWNYLIPVDNFQSNEEIDNEIEYWNHIYYGMVRFKHIHLKVNNTIPLCPNCHSLVTIFRLSTDEVQQLLQNKQKFLPNKTLKKRILKQTRDILTTLEALPLSVGLNSIERYNAKCLRDLLSIWEDLSQYEI